MQYKVIANNATLEVHLDLFSAVIAVATKKKYSKSFARLLKKQSKPMLKTANHFHLRHPDKITPTNCNPSHNKSTRRRKGHSLLKAVPLCQSENKVERNLWTINTLQS